MSIAKTFQNYSNDILAALTSVDVRELGYFYKDILGAYKRNRTVLICGNGGSAAVAEHFVCDHFKGINTDTPLYPKIICLNSNISLLTALSNDIGYDKVFAYQLDMIDDPDILIVISSSGNSSNIIEALKAARDRHMITIALIGFDGGKVLSEELADINIHVQSNNYGIVEDCHSIIMHSLAQHIRSEFAFDKTKIKL